MGSAAASLTKWRRNKRGEELIEGVFVEQFLRHARTAPFLNIVNRHLPMITGPVRSARAALGLMWGLSGASLFLAFARNDFPAHAFASPVAVEAQRSPGERAV